MDDISKGAHKGRAHGPVPLPYENLKGPDGWRRAGSDRLGGSFGDDKGLFNIFRRPFGSLMVPFNAVMGP